MSGFLKHYPMRIRALSPIHIGDGSRIGKKEYIYLPRQHKVIVPDVGKMYADLQRKGKSADYLNYMLKNNRDELGNWLRQQGFQERDYLSWKLYEMDAGDALLPTKGGGNKRTKEIDAFVKDVYGQPYIPGSSLKGMLRSALLAYEVNHHKGEYRRNCEEIRTNASVRAGRKDCLERETARLETKAFCKNHFDEKNPGNAVNSVMAGLIVSDSRPLSVKDLTLCQKVDLTLDGQEKPLPILREAIIPGTVIDFEITIDTTRFPYSINDIMTALNEFQMACYENFYSKFRRGAPERNRVWLGGGTGFLSKTVLYPIYGKDAVRIVDGIYRNTLGKNYSVHKHEKDISLGVAPHVCKCTHYQGKLYDMGLGEIMVLKET